MNVAILTVSSLSLVASGGCLLIMLKMAKELKSAKDQIETAKGQLETKMAHNSRVVRAALNSLEL